MENTDYYRYSMKLRWLIITVIAVPIVIILFDSAIQVFVKTRYIPPIPLWQRVLIDACPGIITVIISILYLRNILEQYDRAISEQKHNLLDSTIYPQQEEKKAPVSPYPFSWPTLEILNVYVNERFCEGANRNFKSTYDTDFIENKNLEDFKQGILWIDHNTNSGKQMWEYVWFMLASLYNKNVKHQSGLDQRDEPYLSTITIERALYKYIAAAYTLSMEFTKDKCFEIYLKKSNIDFNNLNHFQLLREVADKDDDLIERFKIKKAEQCEECLVHGCIGRFKRMTPNFIDMVGPCCDDDILTEEELQRKKRSERLAKRLFTDEMIHEVVANMSSRSPLEELTNFLQNAYWQELVTAYLRTTGVPYFAANGEQASHSQADYEILTTDNSLLDFEFYRWKTLLGDFRKVVSRNRTDSIFIKTYFAEILSKVPEHIRYMYSDSRLSGDYIYYRALMRLATSQDYIHLSVINKIFPRVVEKVNGRKLDEILSDGQYEDVLFRTLYEEANLLGNRADGDDMIFGISMVYEFIVNLCRAIDKALADNNMGINYIDIQSYAGINIISEINDLNTDAPDWYLEFDNDAENDSVEDSNTNENGLEVKADVKPKCKSLEQKLHDKRVYDALTELKKRHYISNKGKYPEQWLRGKDSYAYFCYKLIEIFAATGAQIEVQYISNTLVNCNGNLDTIRRYALNYKQGTKPKPQGTDEIDEILEMASKKQLES